MPLSNRRSPAYGVWYNFVRKHNQQDRKYRSWIVREHAVFTGMTGSHGDAFLAAERDANDINSPFTLYVMAKHVPTLTSSKKQMADTVLKWGASK